METVYGVIGSLLRLRLCFVSITAWVLETSVEQAIIHHQTAIKSWVPLHQVLIFL